MDVSANKGRGKPNRGRVYRRGFNQGRGGFSRGAHRDDGDNYPNHDSASDGEERNQTRTRPSRRGRGRRGRGMGRGRQGHSGSQDLTDQDENPLSCFTETHTPHTKDRKYQIDETSQEVDAEAVYQWILRNRKGSTSISDLFLNSDLCSNLYLEEEVEAILSECKNLLVFKNGLDSGLSVVQVYQSGVKFCFKYTNSTGCDDEDCAYFHLCRPYIANKCNNHKGCRFSHNLNEPHNRTLLEKHNLSNIPLKFVMVVLRQSAFLTCPEHNRPNGECPRDISNNILCPKLHVCDKYIVGMCPFSSETCEKGHNFASQQVKASIRIRGIRYLPPEVMKKITICSSTGNMAPKGSQENSQGTRACGCDVTEEASQIPTIKANPGKSKTSRTSSAPLSKSFSGNDPYELRIDAGFGSTAAGHCQMSSVPYQWQLAYHGVWTNLDENIEIEKRFSDHTSSGYWLQKAQQNINPNGQMGAVIIAFDDMKCKLGKVRRLSVASYCASSPAVKRNVDADPHHTVWVWYWCDEYDDWVPYGETGCGPYQDVLEARYQENTNSTYYFEIDGNDFFYKLNFTEMMQENVVLGTQRKVRRRPLTPGCPIPYYMEKRYFLPQNLPSKEGWAPMDTESTSHFECVPLESAAKQQVERLFWKKMDASQYTILNVARVQNLKLWKDYKRTKEEMLKSLSDAECKDIELNLFHGTPDRDTVHCICSQSFDHRMHGRHATLYGKGAYFSTSAAYSNNYTDRSANTQHMFLARVLVGRWTQGKPDMQRPPPIGSKKHGELYNSVVDNETDPSIYVVFDNAQSYPQYLIEYQQRGQPRIPKQRSQASNARTKAANVNKNPSSSTTNTSTAVAFPATTNPTRTYATNPATANPSATNPTSGHPSTTNPTSAHPSNTQHSSAVTNRTSANPSTTNPTSANPSTTNSTSAHPSTTNPTSAYPSTTQHSSPATNPTGANPSTTNPTSGHPSTTNSTSAYPPTTQHFSAATNPATANPSAANPTSAYPSTTKHSSGTTNPTTANPPLDATTNSASTYSSTTKPSSPSNVTTMDPSFSSEPPVPPPRRSRVRSPPSVQDQLASFAAEIAAVLPQQKKSNKKDKCVVM